MRLLLIFTILTISCEAGNGACSKCEMEEEEGVHLIELHEHAGDEQLEPEESAHDGSSIFANLDRNPNNIITMWIPIEEASEEKGFAEQCVEQMKRVHASSPVYFIQQWKDVLDLITKIEDNHSGVCDPSFNEWAHYKKSKARSEPCVHSQWLQESISWFKKLIIKYAKRSEKTNVEMGVQAVSDIIRLMFLHFYGGCWVDATTWILTKIPWEKWKRDGYNLVSPWCSDLRNIINRHHSNMDPGWQEIYKKRICTMTSHSWFIWSDLENDAISAWFFEAMHIFRCIHHNPEKKIDLIMSNLGLQSSQDHGEISIVLYLWVYSCFITTVRDYMKSTPYGRNCQNNMWEKFPLTLRICSYDAILTEMSKFDMVKIESTTACETYLLISHGFDYPIPNKIFWCVSLNYQKSLLLWKFPRESRKIFESKFENGLKIISALKDASNQAALLYEDSTASSESASDDLQDSW